MKKIKILLNIFFICAFITCVLAFGFTIKDLIIKIDDLKELEERISMLSNEPHYIIEPYLQAYDKTIIQIVRISILIFLYFVIFVSSAAFFIFFNSKLFRKSTYSNFITNSIDNWSQNKAERQTNKQKIKETKKQSQIAELEAKLQELKKDE